MHGVSLSANLARDLHGTVQRLSSVPSLVWLSSLVSDFFLSSAQPLFAVAKLIEKITQLEEEAKLTPDAMAETRMQRERRNARQDRRLEERGEGRRVRLLRGARHYRSSFVAKSSGSRDECAGTRNTRFRIRASILNHRREPRTTKCLVERNFREVKTLRESVAANASCKLRKTRVTEFMARNSDGYRFKFYSETHGRKLKFKLWYGEPKNVDHASLLPLWQRRDWKGVS